MAAQSIPYVYVLTPLTRIGHQRRTVMLGVDMERRTLLLGAIGVAASAPLAIIGFALAGWAALTVVPAGVGLAFFAASRSGRGLKQSQLRTRMDKATSKSGRFMLCGRVIEPLAVRRGRILTATVPVARGPRDGYSGEREATP